MAEQVDALILGSGQGGNPLASALAARGQQVVMVEAKQVGGTCVNSGCTPTKTMIASAQTAYRARRAADYGVHAGPVTVSMTQVRDRKRDVVDKWRSGSEKSLASSDKMELVRGLGRFTGEREVEVALKEGSTRVFKAEKVFINTGLRTMVPPGFEGVPYLTNETVMELDEVPRRLLILGGSYIAVEFAQMFRRFGAEVAIVGREPHLMPREDADISEALEAILREEGVELMPSGPGPRRTGSKSPSKGRAFPARTCCWPRAASPTAIASTSRPPAWSRTSTVLSRLTSVWRPPPPACTPLAM